MSRPLRVEYPGALYHVISRGNVQQDIFFNSLDRHKFFYWLQNTIMTDNIICHAYCLMNNHYHLLIETPDGNLSKAMRNLNGNYSQWFNVKHGRVGHLFQGRYKSFVVEKETYLLEVARYIVLNPVRAGLVDNPKKWKWSSYQATAGITKTPQWLFTNWILSIFSKKRKEAQQEYRQFVSDGINGKDPYDDLSNNFLLGSPQFVFWIWEKTNGSEELKDHPRNERIVGRPTLKEIFEDVKTIPQRNDAIQFAKIRCGYFASEIARYISLDRSVVGKIINKTYNKKTKSP